MGEEIPLRDPRIEGDTALIGLVAEPPPAGMSIPLKVIERVEAYGHDVSGTTQLVLVSATVGGIRYFVRLFSGPSAY